MGLPPTSARIHLRKGGVGIEGLSQDPSGIEDLGKRSVSAGTSRYRNPTTLESYIPVSFHHILIQMYGAESCYIPLHQHWEGPFGNPRVLGAKGLGGQFGVKFAHLPIGLGIALFIIYTSVYYIDERPDSIVYKFCDDYAPAASIPKEEGQLRLSIMADVGKTNELVKRRGWEGYNFERREA
ncbi:MAG: hypothetical protein M1816_001348 [Peltula sp. TS41687]|nr:MAG: hypothetical protein M1816_001348 [Peltula sp. TS41687]